MRYKREIDRKEIVDGHGRLVGLSGLRFPLLNYAAVLADVLTETAVLNRRAAKYGRADLNALMRKIEILEKRLLNLSYDPVLGPFPDFRSRFEEHARAIGLTRKDFKGFTDGLKAHLQPPGLYGTRHLISKINQVALLWIPGLREQTSPILRLKGEDKSPIRWEEGGDLLSWFLGKLNGAVYFGELEKPIFDAAALKTLYRRVGKRYLIWLKMASDLLYFPYNNEPNINAVFPNGSALVLPITALRFYSDRITTSFIHEKKTHTRETTFLGGRPSTKSLVAKETEEGKLLLEIAK